MRIAAQGLTTILALLAAPRARGPDPPDRALPGSLRCPAPPSPLRRGRAPPWAGSSWIVRGGGGGRGRASWQHPATLGYTLATLGSGIFRFLSDLSVWPGAGRNLTNSCWQTVEILSLLLLLLCSPAQPSSCWVAVRVQQLFESWANFLIDIELLCRPEHGQPPAEHHQQLGLLDWDWGTDCCVVFRQTGPAGVCPWLLSLNIRGHSALPPPALSIRPAPASHGRRWTNTTYY